MGKTDGTCVIIMYTCTLNVCECVCVLWSEGTGQFGVVISGQKTDGTCCVIMMCVSCVILLYVHPWSEGRSRSVMIGQPDGSCMC